MPFAYDVNKFILWNAEFIVIHDQYWTLPMSWPLAPMLYFFWINERSGWFPLLHYFIQIKIWLPNFWAWPWPRSCSKTLADGRINVFCHKPRHPLSVTSKLYFRIKNPEKCKSKFSGIRILRYLRIENPKIFKDRESWNI